MEPSDVLIGILVAGACGSVVLTVIVFLFLSAFVECPTCRAKQSKRANYCSGCGGVMSRSQQPHSPDSQHSSNGHHKPDRERGLKKLAAEIAQLSAKQRARLTEMLSEWNVSLPE